MAEYPALPLFTDAMLADCGHLTDAEMGLYLRLLILIWRNPGCRIPNDPEWVARKLSRPRELIFALVNEFCSTDGNYIYQKRLSKEFEFVKKQSKKGSDNAKLRWNKEKSLCNSNAIQHQPSNAPTPTPTPTPTITVSSHHVDSQIRDDFFKNCFAYITEKFPMLTPMNSSDIHMWNQQGYDLEKHIKPAIDSAHAKGLKITSFRYFTRMIEDAASVKMEKAGVKVSETDRLEAQLFGKTGEAHG